MFVIGGLFNGTGPRLVQVAVLCGIGAMIWYRLVPVSTPKEKLHHIVERHYAEGAKPGSVDELRVASLKTSVHADCIVAEDSTIESLETIARAKARGRVPDEMLDDLMRRIFVPGVITNSDQYVDTMTSITNNNEAYAHYVWFELDVRQASLCLMVSLMHIRTAEVVAEWVEESRPDLIGYETNCLFNLWGIRISCRQDAITVNTVKRTPIFRHQSLTLNQQQQLKLLLKTEAIASARDLTHVSGNGNTNMRLGFTNTEPDKD